MSFYEKLGQMLVPHQNLAIGKFGADARYEMASASISRLRASGEERHTNSESFRTGVN